MVNPKNPMYSLMIFFHIIFSWVYAVKLHKRYKIKYRNNYYLAKFENLVENPEYNIKEICKFLNINFEYEMLSPKKSGSSYDKVEKIGFDKKSVYRWKNFMKPWINNLIIILLKKYLKEFGFND